MTPQLLRGARARSARDLAYEWLRDAVTTLPWDREAFLNEVEIAEASGTSRTPVREAMLRLEVAGLIRRVPNKGAYVPALSDADIERMMEARQVIEEWAVSKAAAAGLPLDPLRAQLEEQRQHAADPVAFISDDVDFHLLLVRAGDNSALESTYRSLRHQQLRLGLRVVAQSETRIADVLAEHASVLEAIGSGDSSAAVDAMRRHLARTLAELRGGIR